MANFKLKVCKVSGVEWKQFNSLQRCSCSECRIIKELPKQKKFYSIPQVSKKRKVEMLQYLVLRTEFLVKKENQVCPITKQPTTDIHHKKGRVGSLYLNTTHWVALSREGHKFVEENPEWAKENGYSLDRLTN